MTSFEFFWFLVSRFIEAALTSFLKSLFTWNVPLREILGLRFSRLLAPSAPNSLWQLPTRDLVSFLQSQPLISFCGSDFITFRRPQLFHGLRPNYLFVQLLSLTFFTIPVPVMLILIISPILNVLLNYHIKGIVMKIEKAMINERLRPSKVSWKFCIPTIYNFAIIYSWNLLFS